MKTDLDFMEHADREQVIDDRDLDAQARAKIEVVGELGELVRGRLERAADDIPDKRFAAMWREIDKGIEAELTEGRDAPVRDRAHGGGFWHRVTRFFDRYRGHILVGAVSAGAVAMLALVLRPGDSGTRTNGHDPIDVRPVVHRPAEIQDLDTPGGTGTVFNLDDEDGSTTVIWVTPEDTVEGI